MGYVRFGWLLMWCGQQPPEHQFVKALIIGKVLISADGLCNSESHDVTSRLILLVFYQSLATVLLRHAKAVQWRRLKRGTCKPWTAFCIFVTDTQCNILLVILMCICLSLVEYSGLHCVIERLLIGGSMRETDLQVQGRDRMAIQLLFWELEKHLKR